MGSPPPRVERGEVKYLILDSIEKKARHGYEIIQTIEKCSGGNYRPSAGTIYPTLQMLEEMGFTKVIEQEGRKCYEITPEGISELEENREIVEDAYERLAVSENWFEEFDFQSMAKNFRSMGRAFRSGLRKGNIGSKEIKEIKKTIEEALAQIHKIVQKK